MELAADFIRARVGAFLYNSRFTTLCGSLRHGKQDSPSFASPDSAPSVTRMQAICFLHRETPCNPLRRAVDRHIVTSTPTIEGSVCVRMRGSQLPEERLNTCIGLFQSSSPCWDLRGGQWPKT